MQFHLDGFRPGDPRIAPASAGQDRDTASEPLDVLIVGAGPAGLTLAAQLAARPGIATALVEQKDGPMEKGQADGISCRSMEMFEAFGFADRIRAEAYRVNQTAFWTPDPTDPTRIARTGRVQDVEDGLSEMPHLILNQARVHDMYLDLMRQSPARMVPRYGRRLLSLTEGAAPGEPVTAVLERGDGGTETLRARYVVGCDGARSAVRTAIGRDLRGDSVNQAWGVMDVLAVTDFPDIRQKTLIQSAGAGTVMIIPREGGYLVRLYVAQGTIAEGERVADRNITVESLIATANRVFHPYTLEVKEVVWWSVYQIGQRVTDRFDNAREGRLPDVFIAGDACHTHSPKAGQGMNVSMGDSFNLGWKLAGVIEGRYRPDILETYSGERQAVAQDLIDFDRHWSRVISARDAGDEAGAPAFQQQFIRQGRYTAGVAVRYAPSALIFGTDHQALAPGFETGMRFHSAPVVRVADAERLELGSVVRADGRWRLFAFAPADDLGAEDGAVAALAARLEPLVARITPEDADADAVLDLRAVFQMPWDRVQTDRLPRLLRPRKGRLGLVDYEKVFAALPEADIFALRGVDRTRGALVLVRPDQYIAGVLPLDGTPALARFFDGILAPQWTAAPERSALETA